MEFGLRIIPEIDVNELEHSQISELRNSCFPDHVLDRSYYKQLPHYRVVEYDEDSLIGYMGLDYRVISVDGQPHKILGVIDFCVAPAQQGKGVGSNMMSSVLSHARSKAVDFVLLVAHSPGIYESLGFQSCEMLSSWLRIDEHRNYGVAVEKINEIYVKQVGSKSWSGSHLDWLGYMF